MSTELTSIALQDQALADVGMSRAQARVLADTVCKDASQNELILFANVCRSKGMDPFSGQVFMVKRDGKITFQTGIDGFRSQAEGSGKYAGNDEPVFEYGKDGKPVRASVTVWKMVEGVRVPFTASARWEEFFPGDKLGFMWKSKPHVMLGKCAEAQALRRAFPKQLAGLYIKEEMEQEAPRIATTAAHVGAQLNERFGQLVKAPAAPALEAFETVYEEEGSHEL